MGRDATAQRPRIEARCLEIADLLDLAPVVEPADVHLIDDFLAPGYGQLNAATLRAIETGARSEALMLDPVYSGKTMAGFLERARAGTGQGEGQGESERALLFLHTGGGPTIFAYGTALTDGLTEPGS